MSYAIVREAIVEGKEMYLFLIDNDTDRPMEFDSKEEAEVVRKDFGPGYKIANYNKDKQQGL